MLKFSTKADTLQAVREKTKKFKVLPQVSFTVRNLIKSPESIMERITSELHSKYFIVRSSAISEDSEHQSLAGAYLSVMDVTEATLPDAVNRVMDSFGDNNPENQILVQPMLEGVSMSGVLFTMDPNSGGHYFVINYDESSSTDSVTSGESGTSARYIFHGKTIGNNQ